MGNFLMSCAQMDKAAGMRGFGGVNNMQQQVQAGLEPGTVVKDSTQCATD